MGKISELDPQLINLIAAGEVVERPASVVKELVENSIDAAANTIQIELEEGGIELIQITDDGRGMDADDARLAFKQHATSKIFSPNDLENISTFGFRGEALASIGSVAYIEMETKPLDDTPSRVKIASGELELSQSSKSTDGTKIIIRNLFNNVPARKNFLRSPNTEYLHCMNVFISVALANPHIHFELSHNQKLIHRLPAVTRVQDRVMEIWNRKTAENLYEIDHEINGISLKAFVGSPDIGRKDRKIQYIFVNQRPVTDRTIQKAVSEAYRGFLHRDLYPAYFLYLQIDPNMVDVNVHPRKQEVKFANSQEIYRTVFNSIRNQLETDTKQEMFNRIGEQSSHSPNESIQNSSHYSNKPKVETNSQWQNQRLQQPRNSYQPSFIVDSQPTATSFGRTEESTTDAFTVDNQLIQLFATYIVYQQGKNVVFVDQHAAAEKIRYEKLMKNISQTRSTPLLVPIVIEIAENDKHLLEKQRANLEQVGLRFEDFGQGSIQVTHVPEATPKIDLDAMFAEIISGGTHNQFVPDGIVNEELHNLVATMACHGSVRAGQTLRVQEMQQIINDLAKCDSPYNCPHGRPVSWSLPKYEVEKNFKRVI